VGRPDTKVAENFTLPCLSCQGENFLWSRPIAAGSLRIANLFFLVNLMGRCRWLFLDERRRLEEKIEDKVKGGCKNY
jgi:hypothetical protein